AGKNTSRIAEYIKHQLDEDRLGEQLTLPGAEEIFKKKKKK
ncbi:MAG: IS200/IS605 family transposase, partial [Clostridia bacterium]|nr:IS200/IS605 family transposase [Clostridia bacterium]